MSEKQIVPQILDRMRRHVIQMTGQDEPAGFQIAGLVRMIVNLYEQIHNDQHGRDDITGPRLGMLARLLDEERSGNSEGITPTELSKNQRVSRNTVSALLRGLEDQGMIERRLDPVDHRLFRIRLTAAGRETVETLGPQRIILANQVISGLNPQEQEQLIELLGKLFESLHAQVHCAREKPLSDQVDAPAHDPGDS